LLVLLLLRLLLLLLLRLLLLLLYLLQWGVEGQRLSFQLRISRIV